MGMALALGVAAHGAGMDLAPVLVGITAGTGLLLALLERVHPHDPDWNRPRGDIGTDVLHALVSMISLPELLRIATFPLVAAAGAWASTRLGVGLWPSDLPVLAQVALALVLGELGAYWTHRWMHEVPLLWRLHATHHSAPRLYWLNAARFHPLDVVFTYIPQMLPLVLLGAPEHVMTLMLVVTAVHGMFQHCNVRLQLGPLNWVFSMAELHRWHHSKTLEESNANYGANLIVWDVVFGTRFLPADREPPSAIGIADQPDFPQDYLGQLASPFQR